MRGEVASGGHSAGVDVGIDPERARAFLIVDGASIVVSERLPGGEQLIVRA